MANGQPSRRLFNLPVIIGAVVTASLLVLLTLLPLLVTRAGPPSPGRPTVYLTRIAASSSTPTMATEGPSATSGAESGMPTPVPGVVSIGAFVQVIGTGGDGLRLRDQPGLAGQVLMLGSESEVFQVEQGPEEVDGYTWWYLVGPFDANRRGWAAVNFLQVVQSQ